VNRVEGLDDGVNQLIEQDRSGDVNMAGGGGVDDGDPLFDADSLVDDDDEI
jgi:hypothetical protein